MGRADEDIFHDKPYESDTEAVNWVMTQTLVGISFGTVSAGGLPGMMETDVWAVAPPVTRLTLTDCCEVGTPASAWKLMED